MERITNKRFAAHVLMFDCDEFILRMINNCAPFVEKIYVAYSELPWTYNPNARKFYTNSTSKDIIKKSKHFQKIELIEGNWEKEIEQRNACFDKARADGFNYLIIQDADEFYTEDSYKKNLEEIVRHPNFDVYTTPWYVFWKNLDYVLEFRQGGITGINPGFAVNCNSKVRFESGRTTSSKNIHHLSGVCYHLAYALTDEKIYRKINTWGHSHQFNRDSWYYRKWLNWNENTKNLHPISPGYWPRAVRFSGSLPEALIEFDSPNFTIRKPSLTDNLWDWIEDQKSSLVEILKSTKGSIIKRLKNA